MEAAGTITGAWRWEFLAGAVPAPLAFIVFKKLKEPESWLQGAQRKEEARLLRRAVQRPALAAQFDRRLPAGLRRRRRPVGHRLLQLRSVPPRVRKARSRRRDWPARRWPARSPPGSAITSLLQNIGCVLRNLRLHLPHALHRPQEGIRHRVPGRDGHDRVHLLEPAADQRYLLDDPADGLRQLSLFGGYAIYFAELFPTRLRSTGTSFCYNVGRFAAAAGPFTLGLSHEATSSAAMPNPCATPA